MSKTQTALLASAIGAIALFALVVGAFTASSEPEQAEAICPEGSCLVDLVELLTQDPCENNGTTEAGAALISPCCGTIDGVGASLAESCCQQNGIPGGAGAAIFGCCQPNGTGPTAPAVLVYPGIGGDIFTALFYNAILNILGRCGPTALP